MTPEQFAAKRNEWACSTMIAWPGTHFITAGHGRAVATLDFQPELTQLTGRFHAGAIVALTDETATAAARWETNAPEELRPELFPLTLPMSVNLVRHARRGTLTAEAVVEVRVFDAKRTLVAKLVATQMAPAPPAANGSRD